MPKWAAGFRSQQHPDHLNTPRQVYDDQQQLRWKWDQAEPFGVTTPDENPASLGVFELPLRFPGQYADRETNLSYNYFRDYDAQAGRYVQSDPIGLQGGLNTYSYVASSPLTFVDPSGQLNVTFSTGGSGFAWAGGVSAASGLAFDLRSGNACVYSLICVRIGIGLHFGLQFLNIGLGTSTLCSGMYDVNGGFLSGGPASGSIRIGDSGYSIGTGKVGGGPGWGYAGGFESCKVTLECLKEPDCCKTKTCDKPCAK